MDQRERYIDGCSQLRVERKLGNITDDEYQDRMMSLGRLCCDALSVPIEDLVTMFKEIKEKSGSILDEAV